MILFAILKKTCTEFSSLASFLSKGKTSIERERVLELFCAKKSFVKSMKILKRNLMMNEFLLYYKPYRAYMKFLKYGTISKNL